MLKTVFFILISVCITTFSFAQTSELEREKNQNETRIF